MRPKTSKSKFNMVAKRVIVKIKFSIIFIFLPFITPAFSQTVITVHDTITSDATWNVDTVRVLSNIVIPSGVTVTIAPGTYVKLTGYYGFTINGKLLAIGDPVDSITFGMGHKSNDTVGFYNSSISNGGWKGLYIKSSENQIKQCRIIHIKKYTSYSGSKTGISILGKKNILCGNNFNCNITGQSLVRLLSSGGGDSCNFSNNVLYNNKDYGTNYTYGGVLDISYTNGHIINNNYFHHNYNISGTLFKFIIDFSYSVGSTFSNNIISDNYGVFFLGAVGGTFINNTITKNNVTSGYEIMFIDWHTNMNFVNNRISGNIGNIQINGGNPLFMGNIFSNNDGGVYFVGGSAHFLNNTMVNNLTGLVLDAQSLPELTNNIFWGNNSGTYQISIGGYSNPAIKNCDINKGSTGLHYEAYGYSPTVFENILNIDPNFKNISGGCGASFYSTGNDWNLNTSSSCINAGITVDEDLLFNIDLNGNKRVSHGLPDLGALEVNINKITANGIISSDTKWITDTVNITGNITINSGAKLYIAPGTKVISQGKYSITVNGGIEAIGDSIHPIIFTKRDSSTFYMSIDSCWTGLYFSNTNDTSILSYCTVEYADKAFNCSSGYNIYLDHCNILNNNAAIEAGTSKISFKNTLIYKNQRTFKSVHINLTDAFFENCKIFDNDYWHNDDADNTIMINCIFANNNTVDLQLSDLKIVNSSFINNAQIRIGYANPNIYNSIFYSNSNFFIELYGTNCKPKFYNCLLKPGYSFTPSGTYSINNSLKDLPDFYQNTYGDGDNYDALAADFHIRSISPAIDAGTNNISDLVLPTTDIEDNTRINNNIIDIGPYENQSGKIVVTKQPTGGILCAGDTISFKVYANDTAYYQWQKDGSDISGATKPTFTISSVNESNEGNYSCVVRNSYGEVFSNPAFIKVLTTPEITDEPSSVLINKNLPVTLIAKADGSKPMKYTWLKDGLVLSSDTTFKFAIDSFKAENEGTYVCEMTNNCGSVSTDPAVISLAPSICMVTVSEPNKNNQVYNKIVFEKGSKIQYQNYKIYREGQYAGIYDPIGSVTASAEGVFEDHSVNPKEQAYLYKLTAVNSAGTETDLNSCQVHKTIHLLVTKGETGGVQLDWDQYVGFPYNSYYIYKSRNGYDFYQKHVMSNSTSTWLDDTIVGQNDTVYYFISVKKLDGACYPNGSKKAGGDIFSQSVSNMEDNRLQGTAIGKTDLNEFNLTCYPNPYKEITTITYFLNRSSYVKLEIYNMIGEKVAVLLNNKIQLSGYHQYILNPSEYGLTSGIYFLKVSAENNIKTIRLVGQR